MTLRYIVKHPDPVLRKVAKPVTRITPHIHKLLDDMAETMAAANGVGLAAPQVGILKRVIVVDDGEGIIELINPEIVEMSGEQDGPEGCLSIPGVTGDVKRAQYVRVKGLNRDGEPIEVAGEGLLSRALQHEIDHLNGVLFIDRAHTLYRTDAPQGSEKPVKARAVRADVVQQAFTKQGSVIQGSVNQGSLPLESTEKASQVKSHDLP
ncbi:MAG: peptide deformylase [Candidatus Carbobacillus altaicus]|uniref:Peptide deformylase n=1 Tax=Candidatus Carbonibacillus altaicus TaxID=2163959 RepID=A0A2R6Y133_9BACL|nr:peptide deformylase [Candidatus Carbobacillus altaicus]PTQ56380.1 MAG: Peptide deformylase [Candidatus Carbobacillus altaicus]